ncbi:nucleoside deaminase [Pseudoxanthomonas winnipegensis]|uniref:Nucleoside deaminase n=1 Tax=Pseudoxanthomonas winnipegensis TaxID=2480810 RepID=A0A4Q8LC37_9GAMM|nr:nucleoside deaminase [Pseudoxanthomonas winnipegensis]RZZ83759.1 nucleoside deaminase [Pseudoxanthomonas winnipegensis]TAA26424.1 nucleoside deaminase [Pseudoxanthomonas winnipegensis]TAA42887.1 nucleoside deaminase [Pseudoxanthomonas winnipegensis]TBV73800.1 nucleoside deaminase [Pseudoxanthomonas winnipegensis]
MKSSWSSLPTAWQDAFGLAVDSYLRRDAAPIGAVVTDGAGAIVSRGGNAISSHRLAHAEMEAFAGVPATLDRRAARLFVTVEPCPMCAGALRMMQLGNVHFAARDSAAGATRLLQDDGFMREIPCAVHAPRIPALEQVVVALVTEHRMRTGHTRWQSAWEAYQPVAFAVGRRLAAEGAHAQWRHASVGPAALYESVVSFCVGT